MATSENGGRVRLWTSAALFGADDPVFPPAVPGPPLSTPVAFDGEGFLLALEEGNTVRRWDVADPAHPKPVEPDVDGAAAVLALPTPGHLVVAEKSGGVVLRSPSGDVRLVEDRVKALFRQGGTLVITGTDGVIHLWDLSDVREPRELARLTGHDGAVASTVPGVDGHSLVTMGEDGTIRFWDTDPDRVAERVCATAFPRMTPREWNQYFPGVAEDLPCR